LFTPNRNQLPHTLMVKIVIRKHNQ